MEKFAWTSQRIDSACLSLFISENISPSIAAGWLSTSAACHGHFVLQTFWPSPQISQNWRKFAFVLCPQLLVEILPQAKWVKHEMEVEWFLYSEYEVRLSAAICQPEKSQQQQQQQGNYVYHLQLLLLLLLLPATVAAAVTACQLRARQLSSWNERKAAKTLYKKHQRQVESAVGL